MDWLAKRPSVHGTVMEVTSKRAAQQDAIERLDNRPEMLIAEIERDIRQQTGKVYVSVRGGKYTPQVVAQVADLYRSYGWHVEAGGYWMILT